ncbi:Apc15p protein-domain-containing protein [Ilyonectria robusta]|uniref:Apc15p protein-domain-containing protein n=1 Tax=Ilyonectria robusta TaxID=1079257 RepID=UPI001E8D73DF|nr:Apc15p protein-domain-containing protein [Ilyonectria robusta]KAH8714375.1 Apc15p protein-domain-containing protein [Ilyonectria robusta]
MFTTLPDFTPRDSHSLWYRSSRSPLTPQGPVDNHHHGDPHSHHHGSNHSRQRGHALERSALARLAADEQYMQRRRLNVQNYGSGWLRPPGVPKTLHQLREEKREQEEHQEAMRREQLAQELAEAEAEANPENGMMDDVQLDGAQDLDDEIPDADDEFGLHDDDDDDDEEEDEEDLDEDEGGEAEEDADESVLREERQNDLMAARMRMNDDAFREALARGDPDGEGMYGGDEEIEEEEQGHMLDEDDFAQEGTDDGLGVDMDADLDDDIPEAESGGYEHTDSEAEFTSSSEEQDDDDEDDADISFAPRSAALAPPQSPTLQGRSSIGRPSMDLSNLLSQDGSSFMESSPAGRRGR